MLKTVHRYEQTAARLEVDGFPDLSAGHKDDTIGILSGWRLQLVGAPELEGTRDHLEALMSAVMPYARHRLSGVERPFGGAESFVAIAPHGDKHQLELRSSREGVKPLQLTLDDAELSDLVRCLDRLRLDQRVPLAWQVPEDQPLTRRELTERIPMQQRFGPAVLGVALLAGLIGLSLLLPLPEQPNIDVRESGSRIESNEQ